MGSVKVDGKVTSLNVHGAVYLKEYMMVTSDIILGHGDGYILVYNVTDRESLNSIISLHSTVAREDCPVVIVGLGCLDGSERKANEIEGRQLAKDLRAKFFEADCNTGLNVKEAFFELVREIRRTQSWL